VTARVLLPRPGGGVEHLDLREPVVWQRPDTAITSRTAYAAAPVAADPWGDNAPGAPAVIDWDATLAFRHHLWSWGLGVAEAMDTAQRGMGLDWAATQELVRRSAAEARSVGGRIAAGAGTDHAPADLVNLDEVVKAYDEQASFVTSCGAKVILMASRQLVQLARHADDYLTVYGELLSRAPEPVVLHWLGPMFDPALAGYWGSSDIAEATSTFHELVQEHADAIDGVKVSLLDAAHEVQLRRSLPAGVRLYTGDDFHYQELILGDDVGHSDALLGAFAAIAPAASAALQALDRNDVEMYDAALAPTVALSRHLFSRPTPYYKTGIVFIAWLSGHQPGFTMVGGLQSARSIAHLSQTFRLADAAGLFPDPDLAAARMRALLEVAGVRG
jgi:hypothetical protein